MTPALIGLGTFLALGAFAAWFILEASTRTAVTVFSAIAQLNVAASFHDLSKSIMRAAIALRRFQAAFLERHSGTN